MANPETRESENRGTLIPASDVGLEMTSIRRIVLLYRLDWLPIEPVEPLSREAPWGSIEPSKSDCNSGTSIEFSGNYYTSFDDQGVMREQRDGLVIGINSPEGSLGLTIDSFAEGRYNADGERLTAFDMVELYSNVTTSIPGFGGSTFAQGSSIMQGGAGDYECRTDDMTLTIDGFEPTRSVRVDKILEPPPTNDP